VPAACYFLAEMLIQTKAQVHANGMKQYDQKDKDRIKDLLKTAADAGNGLAQCLLGYMHLIGDNTIVEKNADKGKLYLMKAEAQFAFTELPQAASELAKLYENGMIKTNMTDEELNLRVKQLRSINVDRDYNPLLIMLDATAF
jgi:TPR repeat protein